MQLTIEDGQLRNYGLLIIDTENNEELLELIEDVLVDEGLTKDQLELLLEARKVIEQLKHVA